MAQEVKNVRAIEGPEGPFFLSEIDLNRCGGCLILDSMFERSGELIVTQAGMGGAASRIYREL